MSIEHTIRAILGDKAPNKDRPLWQCPACKITLGEWNPALGYRQLYCPLCREPMKLEGRKLPPAPGAVTIDIAPAIEPPKPPRQLPAPSSKGKK